MQERKNFRSFFAPLRLKKQLLNFDILRIIHHNYGKKATGFLGNMEHEFWVHGYSVWLGLANGQYEFH